MLFYNFISMTGCKRGTKDNGRSNEDDKAEISWKLRSLPPTNYTFKIENFSLLSDAKAECFQSADFEVGGYKWLLAVYPGGNKKKNGDGYISLYLILSKSNKLAFNQEVNVYFKLFVYDCLRDSYWTVQDEKVRRFRGIKREWGFDKLVSVTDFKDESKGYLADDSCIFGAEIFVIENGSKGECLSMVKSPANNMYTWTINKFSGLNSLDNKSEAFAIGGLNWTITVYPKGDSREIGKSLSIYLNLRDHSIFELGRKLYAEFVFRVKNQLKGKHHEHEGHSVFESSATTSWGFSKFMSLNDLNDKKKGFMHNNTLTVELEIQAMTVLKDLS
ncbi:MATH domain and coiled-coil domain-containing protein At2g05420-like [Mercurialis annua]|uniref:MATH domain and coiled-coil domain-containing protein At2g05420-like n=1 Tax=Mercurialis annua TaxID=3986 RepID=UPI00215E8DCB|nr:MATH domain and coiled-coil domain-containing protein At2g05420-like [Mercurialis annua]